MPAKVLKGQLGLFDTVGMRQRWKAPELPSLADVQSLALDTETDGVNKRKSSPIGISCHTDDGRTFYLPFGHSGGNIDAVKVKEWAKAELRDKFLVGLNTGFDVEILRNWGVDLEAQGCSLRDVSHTAALLNENRYKGFGLDDLGLEYCNKTKHDQILNKDRMPDYHASMVGPYAEEDARLTWEVYEKQRPLVEKDQLEKVDKLEGDLIWANNHMERNGARLNVPLLDKFRADLSEEVGNLIMGIWRLTGVRLDPGKTASWDRLFIQQGLDPHYVNGGDPFKSKSSYTEDYLKKFQQPCIQEGLRVRRLLSLQSKYLDKYEKTRRGDFLPFELFQLRAGEEEKGTVVGRYSSARVNIQQVFKVANQIRRFGDGYIIRELMIPDDGFDFFTLDGSQLQYRLFAHLSQDATIIKAYHEGYERWMKGGKDVDYHQMVADLFSLSREVAKNQNFGIIMGLGRQSLAVNIGLECTCQPEEYWKFSEGRGYDDSRSFSNNENHSADCPARKANDLADEYNRRNPSARKTLEYVEKFAKKNGFVPSLLGRRRRYAETEMRFGVRQKTRFYKALASWLQGSEADIVKSKILRLYRERNNIGIHKMRMPVHDEATGDIEKSEKARERLREVANIQEIPCRVPITWQAEFGANWRACTGK